MNPASDSVLMAGYRQSCDKHQEIKFAVGEYAVENQKARENYASQLKSYEISVHLATRILAVVVFLLNRSEKLIGYMPINPKAKWGFAAMSRSAAAILWCPKNRNTLMAKLRKVAITRGPEFLRI